MDKNQNSYKTITLVKSSIFPTSLTDAKQNFILPMSPIHHPGAKVGRIGVSMDQNDTIAPSLPDFAAFLEGPDSSYHLIIYDDGNLGTTNLIKPNGFELSSTSQNRQ